MPPIQKFNRDQAIGQAQRPAPVLDNISRPRVNFGGIASQVGQTAQSFARAGQVQGPQLPGNAFQAEAGAIGEVGQGLASLGDSMFQIGEKRAQAKNYADITEAGQQMRAAAGAFEIWKEKNPNPDEWEGEWEKQSATILNQFGQGKKFSDFAMQRIKSDFEGFNQQQSIKTGYAATKATFRRAGSLLASEIMILKENNDVEGVQRLAEQGGEMGLLHPHQVTAHIFEAQDKAEADELEAFKQDVRADLAEGKRDNDPAKFDSAIARIKDSPLNKSERREQAAIVELERNHTAVVSQAKESIYSDEGPRKALERLEERKPNTDYKYFSGLSNEARTALRSEAEQAVSMEVKARVTPTIQAIDRGEITETEQIEDFFFLDEDIKSLYLDRIGGIKANIKKSYLQEIDTIGGLRDEIQGYNTEDDPDGIDLNLLQSKIEIAASEDASFSLLEELDKQIKGEGIKPLDAAMVSQVRRVGMDRIKNGDYGIDTIAWTDVEVVEKDGFKKYYVKDAANGKESITLVNNTLWFDKSVNRVREIKLDQATTALIAQGKTPSTVVDQIANKKIIDHHLKVEEDLLKRQKAGEFNNVEDLQKWYDGKMGKPLNDGKVKGTVDIFGNTADSYPFPIAIESPEANAAFDALPK